MIVTYDKDPINLRLGRSGSEEIWFCRDQMIIDIGARFLITATREWFAPLIVDDIIIVGVENEDGHLLLSLRVFDEQNQVVLEIRKNELVYGLSDLEDVEFVGQRLTLKTTTRGTYKFRFNSEGKQFAVEEGLFFCNGMLVSVKDRAITFVNSSNRLEDIGFANTTIGLHVGRVRWKGFALTMSGEPRFIFEKGNLRKISEDEYFRSHSHLIQTGSDDDLAMIEEDSGPLTIGPRA